MSLFIYVNFSFGFRFYGYRRTTGLGQMKKIIIAFNAKIYCNKSPLYSQVINPLITFSKIGAKICQIK